MKTTKLLMRLLLSPGLVAYSSVMANGDVQYLAAKVGVFTQKIFIQGVKNTMKLFSFLQKIGILDKKFLSFAVDYQMV